jgi:hypothetical protein
MIAANTSVKKCAPKAMRLNPTNATNNAALKIVNPRQWRAFTAPNRGDVAILLGDVENRKRPGSSDYPRQTERTDAKKRAMPAVIRESTPHKQMEMTTPSQD